MLDSHILLAFCRVTFLDEANQEIGPVDWELGRRERAALTASEGAYQALTGVLSGERPLADGFFAEERKVRVQTDLHLKKKMELYRTGVDCLHSKRVAKEIRLEGVMRPLRVAIDRLELAHGRMRRSLFEWTEGEKAKLLALLFVATETDLLLGREIFLTQDGAIDRLLAARWPDFPGAVVACAPPSRLPGAATQRAAINAKGKFTLAGPRP